MQLETIKKTLHEFPVSPDGASRISTIAALQKLTGKSRSVIHMAINDGRLSSLVTPGGRFVDVNEFIHYFSNRKLGRPTKSK